MVKQGAVKPLKKKEFVILLSERSSITKKNTEDALDALYNVILLELKRCGVCAIPNIGKVILKDKPAGFARNPSTGEKVKTKAKKVLKMKLSKQLKDVFAPNIKKTKK